jgi:hypothetical protein
VTRTPDQSTYHYGDVITLTATPVVGWEFVGWGGDASGSDNPTAITLRGDTTLTATFALAEYSLSVNIVGQGSVIRMPDQSTYHYGDVVSLTAQSDAGWSFVAWSGDLSGGTNPQSLTITANHSLTATFEQDEYTLAVDVVGQGSVTRTPEQPTYHYGDIVTLTATPNVGHYLVGWAGDLSGDDNPAPLVIDGHEHVTATFALAQPVTDVSFTVRPDEPVAGAAVTFTAAFTPAHATQPVTFTWDFGDGSGLVVTTAPQVIYVFARSGHYVVWLGATNGYGPLRIHNAEIAVAAPDRLIFLPLVVRGAAGH